MKTSNPTFKNISFLAAIIFCTVILIAVSVYLKTMMTTLSSSPQNHFHSYLESESKSKLLDLEKPLLAQRPLFQEIFYNLSLQRAFDYKDMVDFHDKHYDEFVLATDSELFMVATLETTNNTNIGKAINQLRKDGDISKADHTEIMKVWRDEYQSGNLKMNAALTAQLPSMLVAVH